MPSSDRDALLALLRDLADYEEELRSRAESLVYCQSPAAAAEVERIAAEVEERFVRTAPAEEAG